MKNLKITVNGKTYDVVVEEIGAAAAPAIAAASAPAAAPVPAAAPAPTPVAAPAVSGGKPVLCPMPGTIINVLVKSGDAVKKGAVLLILEAMKMENEIQAAEDGIVASINAKKGDTVNADDILLTIA